MPIWFWGLVLGGLAWGLYEVLMWERRLRKKRLRRIRRDARRSGLEPADSRTERDLAVLLLVAPGIEPYGPLRELYVGPLDDDTPMAFFEFGDVADPDEPMQRVGFALEYPTDWPTIELGSARSHVRGDAFSRMILASRLTEYMSHHSDWVFAFSGRFACGVTEAMSHDDLAYVLEVAEGVAERIPSAAFEHYRHEEGVAPDPRHHTSRHRSDSGNSAA